MSRMSGQEKNEAEYWKSRLGVILAVAGSAVGFGNFLRFPGLAAQFGGGAFMVAYFVSLIMLGFPVALVEWALGRHAGSKGAHTVSSMLWLLTKSTSLKYMGVIGVASTLILSAFYICLEAWTFIYAWRYASGQMNISTAAEFSALFTSISGLTANGSAFMEGGKGLIVALLATLGINFYLIYHGISRGIEVFCRWAMPVLIVICLFMTVRVLTLDTPNEKYPDRSVSTGLAYMWEPSKILIEQKNEEAESGWEMVNIVSQHDAAGVSAVEKMVAESGGAYRLQKLSMWAELSKPDVWLAAAGQMFFSLSVGFGMVLTYASYLRRRDDVALSSLAAFSANEFCEVGIGGLMTVPAAVAFLGVAGAAGQTTFGLGFNVLPQVFAQMPGGEIFGFLFFLLLALAAVTSAISMLQPGIAYLEEFLQFKRSTAVLGLFLVVMVGRIITAWYSEGLVAVDILNFVAGTICPLVFALILLYAFGWKWGVNKGFREVDMGAAIRIPRFFKIIIKYVTPLLILIILATSLMENLGGRRSPSVQAFLDGVPGAVIPMIWATVTVLLLMGVAYMSPRFRK